MFTTTCSIILLKVINLSCSKTSAKSSRTANLNICELNYKSEFQRTDLDVHFMFWMYFFNILSKKIMIF